MRNLFDVDEATELGRHDLHPATGIARLDSLVSGPR